MPTRWMAYSPETGWGELTQEQAASFREAMAAMHPRLVEGCKLVCIPEFRLSDLKRPALVISSDLTPQQVCDMLNAAGVSLPPMPVSQSPHLAPGTLLFIETAPPPLFRSWLTPY